MATIEARITKVEHDVGSGWYSIHTDHHAVKKLTTKMDPKAHEAQSLRESGEVALIQYSHKQRHDESSGRTYDNYYYERAATATNGGSPSGSGIDQIAPQGQPPQQQQGAGIETTNSRRTDPLDAWRMTLAKAGELAIRTLPMLQTHERGPDDQWRMTLWWARRIYFEPLPSGPDGGFGSTPSPSTPGYGPGAYDEPMGFETAPAHGDDDIPF